MSTENDINKQAQDFLSAMAPKPLPPSARRKKTETDTVIEERTVSTSEAEAEPVHDTDYTELTAKESSFIRQFCSTSHRDSKDKRKHVAISESIHTRLNRFCQTTGSATLYNLLNNILSDFISEHEEIFQSILSKYANKKF